MRKVYIFAFMLLMSLEIFASPARPGVLHFTQPDGTEFEGVLRGSSAFHWIESNGAVVKYSFKDKFYHIAKFTSSGDLELTEALPLAAPSASRGLNSLKSVQSHAVSPSEKQKLQKMFQQRNGAQAPQ